MPLPVARPLTSYAVAWWGLLTGVVVIGAVSLPMTLAPTAFAATLAFGGLLSAAVVFGVVCERRRLPETCATCVLAALVGGFGLADLTSVTRVLGPPALVLVPLFAATGFPLLLARRHRSHVEQVVAPVDDVGLRAHVPVVDVLVRSGPATSLSTRELIALWRASSAALADAESALVRDHLARRRREWLDELSTRDPDGFQRWLASGARAASDPTPYLTHDT